MNNEPALSVTGKGIRRPWSSIIPVSIVDSFYFTFYFSGPLSRFEPSTMCVFLAHVPGSLWSKSLAWIQLFRLPDGAHVSLLCFEHLGLQHLLLSSSLPPFLIWQHNHLPLSSLFLPHHSNPQPKTTSPLQPKTQHATVKRFWQRTLWKKLWLSSLRLWERERLGHQLPNWLNFGNYASSGNRNTLSMAFHYHSHNHHVYFSSFWSSNHGRQRQGRLLWFFFLNCKRNYSLQVFAYTCQKVPLRHSKLRHLNSECRTSHVEDRNQYCITMPRSWVRQVGRRDDSSASGPSSPCVCRVTHKCN